MYWKYPQLIHLVEFRTIEGISPVYIYTTATNKLLIGYVIESTTGLMTDKTLCIYNFSKNFLNNKKMLDLINKYKNKTCIIDCYSESWGKKKVIIGRQILIDWVQEFLEEEKLLSPIIIRNNLDLLIRLNLLIQ